jgi:hypothetical protein
VRGGGGGCVCLCQQLLCFRSQFNVAGAFGDAIITGENGTTGTSSAIDAVNAALATMPGPPPPILQGGNVIVTGSNNFALGLGAGVLTGVANQATGVFSAVISGIENNATGDPTGAALISSRLSSIGSAFFPVDSSVVVNGKANSVQGQYGVSISGQSNQIGVAATEGVVVDGVSGNVTAGLGNVIVDGTKDVAGAGKWNVVIAGQGNFVNGTNSVVVGGVGNAIDGTSSSGFDVVSLGGLNNITTNQNLTIV